MSPTLYLSLGAVVALVLVVLGWRWRSRRQSLPCPAWLHTLVELDNLCARSSPGACSR